MTPDERIQKAKELLAKLRTECGAELVPFSRNYADGRSVPDVEIRLVQDWQPAELSVAEKHNDDA